MSALPRFSKCTLKTKLKSFQMSAIFFNRKILHYEITKVSGSHTILLQHTYVKDIIAGNHWQASLRMGELNLNPWSLWFLTLMYISCIVDCNLQVMRQNFSSHHCVGGKGYSGVGRTCVFHNVCHRKGEGDVLRYFLDSSLPRTPILSENNRFQWDFGNNDFLQLGVYNRFSSKWSPTVEIGPVPNEFDFDNASRVVFHESFAENNPGHFFDLLHTVFALPLFHGFYPSSDVRLLSTSKTKAHVKNRQGLLSKLSHHTPLFLSEQGDICYHNFFVGSPFTSVLTANEASTMTVDKMIDFMLTRSPPSLTQSHNPPYRHRILILEKSTQKKTDFNGAGSENDFNHLANHNETLEYLKNSFGGIAEVESLLPDGLTWDEQISIVRQATVIITPPGGGSYLVTFAHKGAAVIFLDKNFKGVSVRDVSAVGSDFNWWTWIHHFEVLYYPTCTREECPGDIIVIPPRLYHMAIVTMLLTERHEFTKLIPDSHRISSLWHRFEQQNATTAALAKEFLTPDMCSINQNTLVPRFHNLRR